MTGASGLHEGGLGVSLSIAQGLGRKGGRAEGREGGRKGKAGIFTKDNEQSEKECIGRALFPTF